MHGLAGVEMPKGASILRVDGLKRPCIVAEEHQSCGGGERPSPGITVPNLQVTPDYFLFCTEKASSVFCACSSGGSFVPVP